MKKIAKFWILVFLWVTP